MVSNLFTTSASYAQRQREAEREIEREREREREGEENILCVKVRTHHITLPISPFIQPNTQSAAVRCQRERERERESERERDRGERERGGGRGATVRENVKGTER